MTNKKIKDVSIMPGCISCGSCEVICPEKFEVRDIAYVKPEGDSKKNADLIREAAEICPVQVIQVKEED